MATLRLKCRATILESMNDSPINVTRSSADTHPLATAEISQNAIIAFPASLSLSLGPHPSASQQPPPSSHILGAGNLNLVIKTDPRLIRRLPHFS